MWGDSCFTGLAGGLSFFYKNGSCTTQRPFLTPSSPSPITWWKFKCTSRWHPHGQGRCSDLGLWSEGSSAAGWMGRVAGVVGEIGLRSQEGKCTVETQQKGLSPKSSVWTSSQLFPDHSTPVQAELQHQVGHPCPGLPVMVLQSLSLRA